MTAVESERLRGLLHALVRAHAFEALCRELPGIPRYPPGDPRRLTPAVPAAFALTHAADATGDLFSLRRGSPGAALTFGLEARTLFRQALARSGAPAAGRDPAGFPTDLPRGLLGPVPSPGTLIEVLAGAALAFRLRGERRVALVVDDAAGASSGYWHEGLNLAGVNRAPFVLVIEAGREPLRGGPGRASFVDRAPAYGARGLRARTGDPQELLECLDEAVRAAREGEGVQLVEVVTDASDDEVLAQLAGRLRWAEALSDDEVDRWRTTASHEMEEALSRALSEPPPTPDDALAPVLIGGPRGRPVWSPPSTPPS